MVVLVGKKRRGGGGCHFRCAYWQHRQCLLSAPTQLCACYLHYVLAFILLICAFATLITKTHPPHTFHQGALALFQHHDGITGTAKDHVMKDYGIRMVAAVTSSHTLIAEMIETIVLARTPIGQRPASKFLAPEATRESFDELPTRKVLQLNSAPKAVVVYNPLGRQVYIRSSLEVALH